MDSSTQAQIFDPFFTTKGPGKGTGLGLSTVYGIVKQSGGYVWVDSAPGAGASFRIYLPRVHDTVEDERVVVAVDPAPEPNGATVLLAEDEDALRVIVERVLTKHGYTVLSARGGAAALAAAERHGGPIDMLVTDVVMPQMSGQELAARLCERRGDMPVLFLSGYSMDAVSNHGVLRPGALLLKKPFTPQDLVLAVSESLRVGAARTGEHRGSHAVASEGVR
jgi:CheY-like chemotaxis protein